MDDVDECMILLQLYRIGEYIRMQGVYILNQSLGYLQEILSGHTEDSKIGKSIYERISKYQYTSEEQFARDLSVGETHYLNAILREAISYSNQEQDDVRARHLNEIYELLYIWKWV